MPENRAYAERCARHFLRVGYAPIVVHTVIPQLFGDDRPGISEQISTWCLSLVASCEYLAICGRKITEGMKAEIQIAKDSGVLLLNYNPITNYKG